MIRMLSAADKLAEIKRLYYRTSRATIKQDFAKAIELLKSMSSEEERERVAVYMDGLSQMRSDWARQAGGAMESKKWKVKSKTSARSFVPQDLQNFASSSLTVAQEGHAVLSVARLMSAVARLKSRPTDEDPSSSTSRWGSTSR